MLGTLDFTSSEHWAPFNFFFEHSLAHHCSKRVGDVNRGGVANLELDGLSVRRDLNIGINS